MIYLSIGSNLGNRLKNISEAFEHLRSHFPDIKSSITIETEAIFIDNQDDVPYLNCIFFFESQIDPSALLLIIKKIERKMGRPSEYRRWSARIIDIDILLHNNVTLETPELIIPHPELYNRKFLLHLLCLINALDIRKCQYYPKKSFIFNPKFVGILNITTDSFSDGNLFFEIDKAKNQVEKLCSDGAYIIEIGAQSTRPNANLVPQKLELERLEKIIPYIPKDFEISVDSFNVDTLRSLLPFISCINDVSCSLPQDFLMEAKDKKIVLMHSLSAPVKCNEFIEDLEEVFIFFQQKIDNLLRIGFSSENIILDPGIGFGKSEYQNIKLLHQIDVFKKFGVKTMLGHSRKSYIKSFSDNTQRDIETIAVSNHCDEYDFLRVHNVLDHQRFFVTKNLLLKNKL